jgi:hypothetical protein
MTDDSIQPPYLVAEMWWCQSDTCDCVQPRITKISPHDPPRPPWIIRETLWSGTFCSRPEPEEGAAQRRELREAATRFEITLDEKTMSGRRRWTDVDDLIELPPSPRSRLAP